MISNASHDILILQKQFSPYRGKYTMTSTLLKLSLIALTSSTILGACSAPLTLRENVADRIASPAWMVKRPIDTQIAVLTAYERMHEKGAPVTVYIEGDGTADRASKTGKTNDPTPENPVGLHLAAMDKAQNIAYLARPCQYVHATHYNHSIAHKESCNESLYGDERFSAEVITAYNHALNNITAQYGTNGIHIVGYDGGGAIAAILAATRDDILSLRTVAGNLDHDAQSVYLGLPPMQASLNPIDYATELRNVPQHHFIGGQDETIKPAVLHSYLQALGDTPCVKYTMIQEAEHERGWVEKWPELLKANIPECEKPMEPTFEPLDIPEPIFYPRMSGDKK